MDMIQNIFTNTFTLFECIFITSIQNDLVGKPIYYQLFKYLIITNKYFRIHLNSTAIRVIKEKIQKRISDLKI